MLIRALKNHFFKKTQETGLGFEEEYNPNLRSNPNFLTDPNKISKLLEEIEKVSPLCTITVNGSKEEFSSSILDIQTNKKQIILDELFPQHGNNLLDNKKLLKLSAYFNGIHLAFTLNKIQFGSSRDISYYKADFPERIYYPQRRKSPRIEIKSVHIPFSGIAKKNNTSLGGHVFDLSRNGISINLSDNRARLKRGDTIRNCSITLEGYHLEFDLTVRFAKKVSSLHAQTNIGGYFENISNKSQNKLIYFITTLEREGIRKQKT